jgi:hypothetical protein
MKHTIYPPPSNESQIYHQITAWATVIVLSDRELWVPPDVYWAIRTLPPSICPGILSFGSAEHHWESKLC